ncbi:MAG: PPOX class F420-dependent oxidoreductase [Mycobacterium sp.]
MNLPDGLLALLKKPSPCFITTIMADGSPQQSTLVWVDTDGEHILINTVATHQKVRNVERDPRVSVAVLDLEQPSKYYSVRGRVVAMSAKGAVEHINTLAQRYMGKPYPWLDGPTGNRLLLTIKADKVYPDWTTVRAT